MYESSDEGQREVEKGEKDFYCHKINSITDDNNILYSLESNLLAVRGELIREIGIDRRRDEANNTIELSLSRNIFTSSVSRESEVDEMIKEGKRWRLLEVKSLFWEYSDHHVRNHYRQHYQEIIP